MSGNQVGRRMADGGKSKNNMSTPQPYQYPQAEEIALDAMRCRIFESGKIRSLSEQTVSYVKVQKYSFQKEKICKDKVSKLEKF